VEDDFSFVVVLNPKELSFRDGNLPAAALGHGVPPSFHDGNDGSITTRGLPEGGGEFRLVART
jgi:hypothetical protein